MRQSGARTSWPAFAYDSLSTCSTYRKLRSGRWKLANSLTTLPVSRPKSTAALAAGRPRRDPGRRRPSMLGDATPLGDRVEERGDVVWARPQDAALELAVEPVERESRGAGTRRASCARGGWGSTRRPASTLSRGRRAPGRGRSGRSGGSAPCLRPGATWRSARRCSSPRAVGRGSRFFVRAKSQSRKTAYVSSIIVPLISVKLETTFARAAAGISPLPSRTARPGPQADRGRSQGPAA